MRRRARRLSIALTVLGLVIVSGWTCAYFFFNDAVLGRFISAQVNRAERGQFLMGRARFGWGGGLVSLITDVPTRIVAQDYRLLDPDGNEVLNVPYVEADVRMRTLIVSLVKMAVTGRFYIDLHITNAWVPSGLAVITHTASTWGAQKPEINIVAAMSKRKKSTPDGGEFRVTVEKLQLDHVQFAIGLSNKNGATSWYGRLWDGGGQAGLVYSTRQALESKDGPYFFFHIKPLAAGRGEVKLGEFLFPLEQFDALEFGARGDVRQDLGFTATARSLGADVAVDGAITNAYSDHPGVRLKMDFLHGAGPMKLLPPPLREWLAGDPAGQLRINGPFSNILIEADVHGADANIEGVAIRNLSTRLRLASDGILRFDPTRGALAGGAVGGAIDVDLGPRASWRARVKLEGVNPASVPQIPKSLAAELGGKLDARFRLFGSLVERTDHIAVDDIDGTLERLKGGGLPKVVRLAGGLEVMPKKIALRDLALGVEGLTATATGNVDTASGALDAQVRVDGRASAALHQFGLSSDLKVDSLHGQGTVGGRWPRPKLALHVTAGGVGFAQRALDKLEGDITLADGELVFDKVHGTGLGGTIDGQARLGLFADDGDLSRPLKEPTLQARLDAGGISVGALSGAPVLDGAADVSLNLSGPLTRPRGEGRVKLPQLAVYGDRYRDGDAHIAVGDDGWTLSRIYIERVHGGTLNGSGRVGWDGAYSLNLKPKDFPIAAFPNAAGTPFDGRVAGNLTIDGEGARWRLDGSAQLAGFTFRKALIGDGVLKFEPGGDATAVKGSAFKHFTIDGTLTTAPRFAVAVTISFSDVPLESIFPEARELVDVTGTTSGTARVAFNFDSGLSGTIALDKLLLTLAGVEDDGRTRRLSVKNRDRIVVSLNNGVWTLAPTVLTSQLGEFKLEAPQISDKTIQASMKGQIGLELLEYFFRSWFDHTDGDAYVDLSVGGDWSAPRVQGQLDLSRVALQPRDLEHRLNVTRGHVNFDDKGVTLTNFDVNMDGAIAHASGSIGLDGWKPGQINGRVEGELSAKLIQWAFNEKVGEANGRLGVDVNLQGDVKHPRWQGRARVVGDKGVTIKVRRMPYELAFKSGSLQFSDYDLTIGCPKGAFGCDPIVGQIGDADAHLSGVVKFGYDLQPRKVDINFDGKELQQHTPAYDITVSPKLHLFSDDGQSFRLNGNVSLIDGTYSQKFDIKDQIFKPRAVEVDEPWWQGDPRLETMRLDLHVQSAGEALRVKIDWANVNISSVALDISNTLSDPRIQGTVLLEEEGTVKVPYLGSIELKNENGHIDFDPGKRIPDETPSIDVTLRGQCNDSSDNPHSFRLLVGGTLPAIQIRPREGETWASGDIAVCLFSGRSQDSIRSQALGGGEATNRVGSAAEGAARVASGVLGNAVIDPFRKVVGFDTANFSVGGSGASIQLCKNYGRNAKACGYGELGFVGGSKVQGDLQLRLDDTSKGIIRVEYLNQGIDTFQETNTRLKLELNFRIPLGY